MFNFDFRSKAETESVNVMNRKMADVFDKFLYSFIAYFQECYLWGYSGSLFGCLVDKMYSIPRSITNLRFQVRIDLFVSSL